MVNLKNYLKNQEPKPNQNRTKTILDENIDVLDVIEDVF